MNDIEQVSNDVLTNLRYGVHEGFSTHIPDTPIFLDDLPGVKKMYLADLALSLGGLIRFMRENPDDTRSLKKGYSIKTAYKEQSIDSWVVVGERSAGLVLLAISKRIRAVDLETGLFKPSMFFAFLPHVEPLMAIVKSLGDNKIPFSKCHKYLEEQNFSAGMTNLIGVSLRAEDKSFAIDELEHIYQKLREHSKSGNRLQE